MKNLEGKTILEVVEGEDDNWDQACVLKMTDGTMFYVKSGSASSMGILDIEEITSDELTKNFKKK